MLWFQRNNLYLLLLKSCLIFFLKTSLFGQNTNQSRCILLLMPGPSVKDQPRFKENPQAVIPGPVWALRQSCCDLLVVTDWCEALIPGPLKLFELFEDNLCFTSGVQDDSCNTLRYQQYILKPLFSDYNLHKNLALIIAYRIFHGIMVIQSSHKWSDTILVHVVAEQNVHTSF